VSKQLAVRHVASDNDADFSVGFDRKSDFLTTSHIFRLFGAGNSVTNAKVLLYKSEDKILDALVCNGYLVTWILHLSRLK
jgi:hypothetical protein